MDAATATLIGFAMVAFAIIVAAMIIRVSKDFFRNWQGLISRWFMDIAIGCLYTSAICFTLIPGVIVVFQFIIWAGGREEFGWGKWYWLTIRFFGPDTAWPAIIQFALDMPIVLLSILIGVASFILGLGTAFLGNWMKPRVKTYKSR